MIRLAELGPLACQRHRFLSVSVRDLDVRAEALWLEGGMIIGFGFEDAGSLAGNDPSIV